MRASLGVVLGLSVVVSAFGASRATAEDSRRLRAHAVIRGGPNNSTIVGEVVLTQRARAVDPAAPATDPGFANFPEPTVTIVARIYGSATDLTPGAHGMHIHEVGKCEAPGFTTAGSHFDPGPFANNVPVDANHPFHMGDIPNLIVKRNGMGVFRHRTSRITLSAGPLSIFDADGSAIVLHMNPDRGIPGQTGASGGGRVACGVIQLLPPSRAAGFDHPDFEDDDPDKDY